MITGDLKGKVDRIWDAFWPDGISNPLEIIEQITYLLFLRRLDELLTPAEKNARVNGGPVEDPKVLPDQSRLRWSNFKPTSTRLLETFRRGVRITDSGREFRRTHPYEFKQAELHALDA